MITVLATLRGTIRNKMKMKSISGGAKHSAEKSLVTKLITDINGVNSVVNNMTIEVAKN